MACHSRARGRLQKRRLQLGDNAVSAIFVLAHARAHLSINLLNARSIPLSTRVPLQPPHGLLEIPLMGLGIDHGDLQTNTIASYSGSVAHDIGHREPAGFALLSVKGRWSAPRRPNRASSPVVDETIVLTPLMRESEPPGESPAEPLTPREAAKGLVRLELRRGSTLARMLQEHPASWWQTDRYRATVGGTIFNGLGTPDARFWPLEVDQIGVHRIGQQECWAVFPLREIYAEVWREEHDDEQPAELFEQGRLF